MMKKNPMLQPPNSPVAQARGFSLLELLLAASILLIVTGATIRYIGVATQRGKTEQVKVDLTEEARGFVDEFERDVHQAGYPGCALFNTGGGGNCSLPATLANGNIAAGLVSISNYQVIFEGDVDGDGVVDSVRYRIIDSAGNFPPAGTCPCTVQRSQVAKVDLTAPTAQPVNFSQELPNVVNSGAPVGTAAYGNGLAIAGNTLFGGTNDAYYAAVTTVKDVPVFSFFDQNGLIPGTFALPQDDTTPAGYANLLTIKAIRLSINVLGNAATGYDAKTKVRQMVTLVGNGRRNN
jgi:prepilin-type N-terminal cleavage/methylation domain-containing protein